MKENKFIDSALHEHARLENNPDQVFLDELENKLDAIQPAPVIDSPQPPPQRKNKTPWLSLAAVLALSAIGVTFYAFQKREDVSAPVVNAEHVVSKSTLPNTRQSTPLPKPLPKPLVSKKPSALSSSIAKTIVSNTTSPNAIPVPNHPEHSFYFDHNEADFGDFDDGADRSVDADRADSSGGLPERSSQEKYGKLTDQKFHSPLKAPLSTFSIDIDTASYTNIRRHILDQRPIHPDAVRIEEMINYFDYQYPQPAGTHPFSVTTQSATCPWNEKHRLVRIGLQGKTIAQAERQAANLVFLIDVSGSMQSTRKLPLLVQSFQILLDQLNENDRVSIVVYAGNDSVLLNPTPADKDGQALISSALTKLTASGSTHGSAGIKTAYQLAATSFIKNGTNRIILATDGDFNVGLTNHDELLSFVKTHSEKNIFLTILGFGTGNLNDQLLEKLTNDANGNYHYIDSLREGQRIFRDGLTGTLQTIAKDVKIQVEFNPAHVASYRLIGYANRRLRDQDFHNDKIDAGDIGAGHNVTALYEIIPTGVKKQASPKTTPLKYQPQIESPAPPQTGNSSPELLTVNLRYKQPEASESTLLTHPHTDNGQHWKQADQDFQFSSAVALWGMTLRNSPHHNQAPPALIQTLATQGKGKDPSGKRTEFLDLLRRWQEK